MSLTSKKSKKSKKAGTPSSSAAAIPAKTHEIYHLLVLDRSSSMESVRDVTIKGFNENLQSCRTDKVADGIEQFFSLVTFNQSVDFPIWRKPISDLADLTTKTYVPSGMTALYDAIGVAVSKLQSEIQDKIEKQDANVVVTVFTDGEENSSQEWRDYSKLSSLLAKLRDSRMWTFTFIGCSEGTLAAAKGLGFTAANTMQYAATPDGTRDAFRKLSQSRSVYNSKISASTLLKGVDAEAYTANLLDAQDGFFAVDTEEKNGKNGPSVKP